MTSVDRDGQDTNVKSSPEGVNVVPRRFLVLTTQRTGSGWLMDRINCVMGAEGHMELFYNDIRRAPPKGGCNDFHRFVEIGKRFGRGRRPGSVFGYLDSFYSRPGAIGFKLMYSQLREYPEILSYIALRRLPVVHLIRRNHLQVVPSQEVARTTTVFHSRREDKEVPPPIVYLEPSELISRVQWLERKRRFMQYLLRLLPVPVHETSYEDLRAGNAAFERLCRFIGVDSATEDRSRWKLAKSQVLPPKYAINNFHEVRAALQRNGFEDLLQ